MDGKIHILEDTDPWLPGQKVKFPLSYFQPTTPYKLTFILKLMFVPLDRTARNRTFIHNRITYSHSISSLWICFDSEKQRRQICFPLWMLQRGASLPCNAEAKTKRSFTSTPPHAFRARCLNNVTFNEQSDYSKILCLAFLQCIWN